MKFVFSVKTMPFIEYFGTMRRFGENQSVFEMATDKRNKQDDTLIAPLLGPLRGIRRRQQIQTTVEWASRGVLCGAVMALGVFLSHLSGQTSMALSPPVLAVLLACGGLLGVALGTIRNILWPGDPFEPARQADGHYKLKDRLLTAQELSSREQCTPLERLQRSDAMQYAGKVQPREVMPLRLPRNFSWSILAVTLATAICFVSPYIAGRSEAIDAKPPVEPLPEIVAAAAALDAELVEKIDELAKRNSEEKTLAELAEKLQQLMERLAKNSTDRKESLALLSEMEEAVRAAMSQLQVEAVDASMKEIAEALRVAEATKAAAQALRDEQYAQAADELEKIDAKAFDVASNIMSKPERQAISEQMRQAMKKMETRGQESLLNAAKKMAEACEGGDGEDDAGNDGANAANEGTDALAAESRKQGIRKEIYKELQGKLALLEQCKSDGDGGDKTSKSRDGSKNWGTGAAGNPNAGEETNLDGHRVRQNLPGISDGANMTEEGDSEFETVRSDEAPKEKTMRAFRELFQEYKKMSEAVLEAEPIPQGQRQMIRRYFESIRPENDEAE